MDLHTDIDGTVITALFLKETPLKMHALRLHSVFRDEVHKSFLKSKYDRNSNCGKILNILTHKKAITDNRQRGEHVGVSIKLH